MRLSTDLRFGSAAIDGDQGSSLTLMGPGGIGKEGIGFLAEVDEDVEASASNGETKSNKALRAGDGGCCG